MNSTVFVCRGQHRPTWGSGHRESPLMTCALACFTIMRCEHKTTQQKYANGFGTNHLSHNKSKTVEVWKHSYSSLFISGITPALSSYLTFSKPIPTSFHKDVEVMKCDIRMRTYKIIFVRVLNDPWKTQSGHQYQELSWELLHLKE